MLRSDSNSPNRNRFVVIEGVDGVGKTTVAKKIAERLGGVYVKTPLDIIEDFVASKSPSSNVSLRYHIDSYAHSSPRTRFLFYLYCVSEAAHHINKLLKTSDVICDRFLASSIAYHRVLDPELPNMDFSWVVEVVPDYQVLLEVSNETEHARRLSGRNGRTDNILESDLHFRRQVNEEFCKLGLEKIDTTYLPISVVVEKNNTISSSKGVRPASRLTEK
jgi:dTMP kinase